MKHSLAVVGIVAVLGSGSATAQKPDATQQKSAHAQEKSASADAAFMRQAAADGMAEVEHGRLAAKQASAADVRQFGQRMVDDHSKANDELKSLASKKGVTLPAELEGKHKAMQEKLAKLKGPEFDKTYMAHMVDAHEQAVALFEKEAKGGKDACPRLCRENVACPSAASEDGARHQRQSGEGRGTVRPRIRGR
jgi:putative membrane protein